MFDSLHLVVVCVLTSVAAVVLGLCVWHLGLLPVLLGLGLVAFLTQHRLWVAALLGLLLGLQ